jgi:hypothetical protein
MPNDLGTLIDSIDEAGLPVDPNAAGTQVQLEASPAPTTNVQDFGAMLDSMPEVELPSYLQAMNNGLKRGIGEVKAAVPTLQGVAAEATGDTEAASDFDLQAKAIQAQSPQQVVSDVLDIQSADDFLYWASERLGEQAPNMAAMALGGGAGALLAKLVGRGIISAELGATIGAFFPNVGLETSSTAQEQRMATGSYNPATSVAAGIGKGILETYGPVKFMKEIRGASVLGAMGRAAVREGLLTEPWQEAIDIGARKLNDPNYSFFNEDMTWLSPEVSTRLAESTAAGLLVGGGYAGPTQAVFNTLERFAPEKADPNEPPPIPDMPSPVTPEKAAAPPPTPTGRSMVTEGAPALRKKEPGTALVAPYTPKPLESDFNIADLRSGDTWKKVPAWHKLLASLSDAELATALAKAQGHKVHQEATAGPFDSSAPWVDAKYAEGMLTWEQNRRKKAAAPLPVDEPFEPGALSWLRELQLKNQLRSPYEPPITPAHEDVTESTTLDDDVKLDWQTRLARTVGMEEVLNIEDDNLPRYATITEDGRLGNKVLTDTDLEEHLATGGPLETKPRLLQVDMKSLQPGMITAEVWDLPEPEDARIWFLPGTTVPEQQALLQQYEQIWEQVEQIKPERLTQGLNARERAEQLYAPLLDSGLRVIPSRGSSFNYNGVVEGAEVSELPKSRRGTAAYWGPHQLVAGAKLYPPTKTDKNFSAEEARVAERAMALDFNKIPDDAFTVDEEGTVTLTKDIDPRAVTYGYGVGFTRFAQAAADMYDEDQLLRRDENADPSTKEVAADAIKWWKEYLPYLKAAVKKLGVKLPALIVAESAAVSYAPSALFGYDSAQNVLHYNPFHTTKAFTPPLESKEGFLLTLLHEIGHAITMQTWAKLPPRVQGLVLEGYKRAMLTTRITGSTSHVQPAQIDPAIDVQHRYYYLTFTEYLAEQSRRWMSASATAMSPQEKFYKSIGRKLQGLYNGFVEKLGEKDARLLFMPDYSFNTWYDYLEETQNSELGVKRMVQLSRRINIDFRVPQDLRATYLQVLAAVQAWGHLVPADVTLVGTDYTPDMITDHVDSEKIEIEYGSYSDQQNVITMIIGSLALTDNPNAANRLLVHEAFHSIEDYLTPEERAILVQASRDLKTISHQEIGNYYRYYRESLRDAGLDPDSEMNMAVVKMLIENEAMARLVEQRMNGKDFTSEVNSILDRILELFYRIVSMVRGNGFQSTNDVLKAFYRGDMTERRNREIDLQELEEMDLYGEQDQELDLSEPSMSQIEKNDPKAIRLRQQIYDTELRYKGFGKDKVYAEDHAKAREDARLLRKQYRDLKKQLGVSEPSKGFKNARQPNRVQQVEPGLEVRVFEDVEDIELDPKQEVIVTEKSPAGGRVYAFVAQGQPAGYIMTHLEPGIGWDIDMIDIAQRSLGGITLVKKMLNYLTKDIGAKLQASGTLSPMGYALLKASKPEQVAFHVRDTDSGLWLSPRQIQRHIDAARSTGDKAQSFKYNRMLKQVPESFFKNAAASTQFSKDVAFRKGTEREAARGQEEANAELIASLKGDRLPVDPMLENYAGKKEETEPEHYGMANVFTWLRGTPQLAPNAGIIMNQADKISRASKWFFSLQQLTWRNPHIPQLRDYMTLMQQYNTRRMEWTSRADNTLRSSWDIPELTANQKDAVSEFLFWLTEMDYRTPAERIQGVVRQPTTQEVQAYVTAQNFSQEMWDAYVQIKSDFDDFLLAIETVTIQNINRTMAATQPQAAAKAILEVRADMAQLRKKPYFPMTRFGEYYITIRNQFLPNRPVVHFSAYATERERNAAMRDVARQHPGMDLIPGKVPQNVQEFMGLPVTLLKAIRAKLPGMTQSQKDWLEQFEAMMAPERSFRKRFLKRKGTPGYSYDGMRVYAHYFRSGANYLARIEYKDQLEAEIKSLEKDRKNTFDIKSKRSMIVEYMQQHLNYVMTGGKDWATFKGLVSVFQLGFSVAAAGMNLMQTPTVTHPYLANIFGYGRSMKELMKVMRATKHTFGKPAVGTPQHFIDVRDEMIRQGKIDIGQAPELGGYAEGSNLVKLAAGNKGQRAWRSFSYWSMWMFQHAEQFNRELAFAAAYNLSLADPTNPHLVGPNGIQARNIPEIQDLISRLGLSLQQATAAIAAREALDRTQFIYAPWARPRFLQSGAASSVLVFFQFMQNMIYALGNNPGKTHMLVMLLILYGVAGLPGADDLDKLVKWFSRRVLGKNFSPLDFTREQMVKLTEGTIFDEVGADVVLHGISRYSFGAGFLPDGYGVPQFDASANGSMGNVIPGLAPALSVAAKGGKWDEMTAQVINDVAGAGFGQMFAWMKFMDAGGPFTTEQKKWEMVMPRASKAASKAWRYYWEGGDVDPNTGQTFAKFNMQDPDDAATVAWQLLGFTPRKISAKWEELRMAKDLKDWYQYRKGILLLQQDVAARSGDKDAEDDVSDGIARFNEEVQNLGIPSMGISRKGLKASVKARARTRALRDEGIGLTPGEQQINEGVKKLFPDQEVIDQRRVK